MSILLIPVWVIWWLGLASIFTGFICGLIPPFRRFVSRVYRLDWQESGFLTSALVVAGFAMWFLTSIILAGAA